MSACIACAIEQDVKVGVPEKHHTCPPGWPPPPAYAVYEASDDQVTWREVARVQRYGDSMSPRPAWIPPIELAGCWIRTRNHMTGQFNVWYLTPRWFEERP